MYCEIVAGPTELIAKSLVDEALMLEKQILALDAPSSRTLKAFRRWFNSKAIPVLWGHDTDLYTQTADLAALAPTDSDRLNLFIRRYCGWFLKVSCFLPTQVWSPQTSLVCVLKDPKEEASMDADDGMYYFSDRRVQCLALLYPDY